MRVLNIPGGPFVRVLGSLGVLLMITILLSNLPRVNSASLQADATPVGTGQGVPGTGERTFPETGKMVMGLFLDYWDAHGGLAQQGFPISDELTEVSDLDHKPYTVQYFERAVFEYHPENAGTPYTVLLSQLGTYRYKALYGAAGAPGQTPNQTTGQSHFFAETGHWVGGKFWDYWQAHGGLAQQGYPISDEFTEASALDPGKQYTVQYFERAVFERHPENAGTPFEVLLAQLGTLQYRAKYTAAPPTPAAPPPTAAEPSPTAGTGFEVQVVLSFKHIAPMQLTVPAGHVRFIVTNVDTAFGQTRHNFAILNPDGSILASTPTFAPDEGPKDLEVDLRPGTYPTKCTVPGHAEAGMVGTLVVPPAAP